MLCHCYQPGGALHSFLKLVLKHQNNRITPTSFGINRCVYERRGENTQPGLRPPSRRCNLQSAIRLNAHALLSFVLGICERTANFKLRGLHFCYSSSWMQWNYLIIHSLLSGRQTWHATLSPCLLGAFFWICLHLAPPLKCRTNTRIHFRSCVQFRVFRWEEGEKRAKKKHLTKLKRRLIYREVVNFVCRDLIA